MELTVDRYIQGFDHAYMGESAQSDDEDYQRGFEVAQTLRSKHLSEGTYPLRMFMPARKANS